MDWAIPRRKPVLPEPESPNSSRCESTAKSTHTGAQVGLGDPDRQAGALPVGHRQAGVGQYGRQQAYRWGSCNPATPPAPHRSAGPPTRPGPRPRPPRPSGAAPRGTADPPGTTPRPGASLGTFIAARRSTAESDGIAQPQLQPVAEEGRGRRPDVVPPGGRADHVHAVGEAPVGQVVDGRFEVIEVGTDGAQPSTTRNTSPNGSSR